MENKKERLSKQQILDNKPYWEKVHKEVYLETDKNLKEVAKFLGLSRSKITCIFKFLCLRVKTKKESAISSYARRKKTNLERYGIENPMQSEKFKEKMKKTNIDRYGVGNPMQSEIVKEKFKQTCLKNHGVGHPSQSLLVREKVKKTNLDRYGVENPFQSERFKEKIKKTNLERYGVEHPAQSEVVMEKMKKTNLERHGVENASQSEVVKEKKKQTSLKNYGVEYSMQSKVVKEKSKKTSLKNYGVEHPAQSEVVKEKIKKTMVERHSVEYPMQSEVVREKSKQTVFGVTLYQLNNWCEGNGYLFLDKDSFNGVMGNDSQGNYIGWYKYNFKHLECGNGFKHHLQYFKKDGYKYIKCPYCYPNVSQIELKYRQFIKDLGIKAGYNRRDIISPYEIDIFLPDYSIAMEINGDYWHSEERIQETRGMSSKEYHQMKTDMCIEKGIILYHIWESDNFEDWAIKIKSWFNK